MSPEQNSNPPNSHVTRIAGLTGILLVGVVVAVFAVVSGYDFVNFDDYLYVKNNPHVTTGLTAENIWWAFTSIHGGYWIPLTWLSYMLDTQIYGTAPGGYHLTNVIIHAASVLALLVLLCRTTGDPWKSAFVAALFALHPLQVESVAWITERKDVLCAFFGFIALIFYSEYVTSRKSLFFSFSFFAFILGTMSKPMLVTLPVIMMLMDYWPLARYTPCVRQGSLSRDRETFAATLREKFWFYTGSIVFSALTIYTQHAGSMTQTLEAHPLELRIANAATSYIKYLGKIFWPVDLAVFYPLPATIPLWQVACSITVLLAVTAAAVRFGRRQPSLIVGWLWFLVTLFPVIGLVQVGDQAMADRFTYLPAIGIFIVVAWGIPELLKAAPYQHILLPLGACLALTACIGLSRQQLTYWRDTLTLFRHAQLVTSANFVTQTRLGFAFSEKGLLPEAIDEFRKAAELSPDNSMAHNALGVAYAKSLRYDEAINEFSKALALAPDNLQARTNLGQALVNKDRIDEAILEFRKVLEADPDYTTARLKLAAALAKKGLSVQAAAEYMELERRVSNLGAPR